MHLNREFEFHLEPGWKSVSLYYVALTVGSNQEVLPNGSGFFVFRIDSKSNQTVRDMKQQIQLILPSLCVTRMCSSHFILTPSLKVQCVYILCPRRIRTVLFRHFSHITWFSCRKYGDESGVQESVQRLEQERTEPSFVWPCKAHHLWS
jgi:hypothetical protein